jgi:hypothetical protein
VDGNGGDPDTHKAAGAPTPPKPPPGQFRPQSASSAGTGEYSAVRDRIAKFYGAIGAGASMISQNDGYGLVADAYSGDLADAWIAAARQNENVARIVAFLESGGPVGELVIAHFILVGGMVYVSGRGPDLDFLYAGKFAAHRAAAAASRAADIAQAEADAAAQAGLEQNGGGFAYTYSVDDTPSAPGQ